MESTSLRGNKRLLLYIFQLNTVNEDSYGVSQREIQSQQRHSFSGGAELNTFIKAYKSRHKGNTCSDYSSDTVHFCQVMINACRGERHSGTFTQTHTHAHNPEDAGWVGCQTEKRTNALRVKSHEASR